MKGAQSQKLLASERIQRNQAYGKVKGMASCSFLVLVTKANVGK